jgi:putative ABC transport system substrate-binding protein
MIGRRQFVTLLGGAAATWPAAVHAQQPAIPVVAILSALSQEFSTNLIAAWRKGLRETGYVEGHNVAVEFRYANGQYERLPAFAGDLVNHSVGLIVAVGPPAALAAKIATTSIPIVFVVGLDPVAAGLVASFNRPGGNATGMTLITGPLGQKRLEILRELVPKLKVVPMLLNPTSPDTVPELRDVQSAAQAMGIELRVFQASKPSEIDAAFATLAQQRPDALLVGSDPFFTTQAEHFATLAARLGVPTIYPFREFTAAGGLVSYGTNIANAYRQAGIYTGRILKGDKPAQLPVMQPTTFELVINLKTAKALSLEIPATLHARSDEVIE